MIHVKKYNIGLAVLAWVGIVALTILLVAAGFVGRFYVASKCHSLGRVPIDSNSEVEVLFDDRTMEFFYNEPHHKVSLHLFSVDYENENDVRPVIRSKDGQVLCFFQNLGANGDRKKIQYIIDLHSGLIFRPLSDNVAKDIERNGGTIRTTDLERLYLEHGGEGVTIVDENTLKASRRNIICLSYFQSREYARRLQRDWDAKKRNDSLLWKNN